MALLAALSTVQAVLSRQGRRREALITNTSNAIAYLGFGRTPSLLDHDFILPSGSSQRITNIRAVNVIFSAAPLGGYTGGIAATEALAPAHHTQAYRAKGQQGATVWGVFWKRAVGTSIKVINPEVRVDKGNRPDTKGFVTLVAVKSVDVAQPEDVLFFGGLSWNDGLEQSVTALSNQVYDLTLVDGEFPYVQSTGETTNDAIPTQLDDADGVTHTVEAGDVLFYYSNMRVDGDQASITAGVEVWDD